MRRRTWPAKGEPGPSGQSVRKASQGWPGLRVRKVLKESKVRKANEVIVASREEALPASAVSRERLANGARKGNPGQLGHKANKVIAVSRAKGALPGSAVSRVRLERRDG